MKDKTEKDNKNTYPQSKIANRNKSNETPFKQDQDKEGNQISNIDDADLGNQMDDDILVIDEDALENPNPTKQDGEENERPGGGLRK